MAGPAAAAALGGAGFQVEVFESRPFLGGRATSSTLPCEGAGQAETIDCQHICCRCCVDLLDFYERLGAARPHPFYREFYFLEPGGRISVLRRGRLPAPFHFDDWEWGVDLFAPEPLVFKKLIYEMRFDEVSAVYAAFGQFFIGVRCPVQNLGHWLGIET